MIAYLALFIALGGGAYAANRLPANSVGSAQIKSQAVKNADIASNSVTSPKVKDGSLLSKDFKVGQLPSGPRGQQGLKGDSGAAGANGANGTNGLSKAYYLTRTSTVNPLPATGTLVATLTGLPPGSYLITGSVVAINFGAGDFTRCNIRVGGVDAPGATAWPSASSQAVGITATAATTSAATFDAALRCLHDSAAPAFAGIYLESIQMWAVPVDTLDARTAT